MADEANRSSAHPVLHGDAAERVAGELKRTPPWLDDMTRARMERNLVAAVRAREAVRPEAAAPARLRFAVRWRFAGALALAAAVGAAVGLAVLDRPTVRGADLALAQFELRVDDTTVQSGRLAEGQTLEAGKRGHIEVSLGASRLDIARDSRVRFDRLSSDDVRLSLVTGGVDVEFHPDRPGEQQLSVATRAALVQVVGTRFSVRVDGRGDTRVEVSEGVVRVRSRVASDERLLRAGESALLALDAGDEHEQAVRAAMEEGLADVTEAADGAAPVVSDEPVPLDREVGLDGLDMDFTLAEVTEATAASHGRLSHAGMLDVARRMLRQGKHSAARDRLRALAASPAPVRVRVEALSLIAESYTAQGYIPRAEDTYRQAAYIAPGHPAGHNALFALARLIEGYTLDKQAAISAYQRYLRQAPTGALAPQASDALCRLGEAGYCGQ